MLVDKKNIHEWGLVILCLFFFELLSKMPLDRIASFIFQLEGWSRLWETG